MEVVRSWPANYFFSSIFIFINNSFFVFPILSNIRAIRQITYPTNSPALGSQIPCPELGQFVGHLNLGHCRTLTVSISSIRAQIWVSSTPLESGRRALRSDAMFEGIWPLWILTISEPPWTSACVWSHLDHLIRYLPLKSYGEDLLQPQHISWGNWLSSPVLIHQLWLIKLLKSRNFWRRKDCLTWEDSRG